MYIQFHVSHLFIYYQYVKILAMMVLCGQTVWRHVIVIIFFVVIHAFLGTLFGICKLEGGLTRLIKAKLTAFIVLLTKQLWSFLRNSGNLHCMISQNHFRIASSSLDGIHIWWLQMVYGLRSKPH